MTDFGPADVAFIGQGRTVPCWYRCAIPAQTLACEWAGVNGQPIDGKLNGLSLITGNTMNIPDLFSKKVVILQQPSGPNWRQLILELRDAGVKVVYEVDDWLDSVREAEDHENREYWTRDKVQEYYDCINVCDAMIVTTNRLKKMYEDVTDIPIFVCRNGLDLGRYQYEPILDRKTINVGWAGGVGHKTAAESWMRAVRALMNKHDNVNFVNIGMQHFDNLDEEFPGRILRIPIMPIENFPAAMRNIDIAIGPARETEFFKGKSDLRYLEASALMIPGVYHPHVYGDTVFGRYAEAGQHDESKGWGALAETWEEAFEALDELVRDEYLRHEMGNGARHYVRTHRSAEAVSEDWINVLEEVTE